MFKNVSGTEYGEEYRKFYRIFMAIHIPSIYDVHDLCHEAIQIYYGRGCKAVRYLCCIDAMRKKHSRQYKHNTLYYRSSFSEEDYTEHLPDFEQFQNKVDIASIWKKVRRVLDKHETKVFLGFVAGKSGEDIAKEMKVSASRVSQLRRELLRNIRKTIQKDLKEPLT